MDDRIIGVPAPTRCAAHPGRPAVDACPACGRPRCAVDATGPDCAVCRSRAPRPDRLRRTAQNRELLVRAALASYAAALLMGVVVSEYVQAEWFEYLAPLVLGLLCGFAASSAAGNPGPGVLANRVRLVCASHALLGTGFGFVLEGTYGVLSTSSDVLLPYVAAVGAAWLWTTPPKRRRRG